MSIGQDRYPTSRYPYQPGYPQHAAPAYDVSAVNDNPRTAQVATYTVTGDAIVTVEINNVSIATAAAGGSTALTAVALAAAINAEPLVSGHVSALASSDDVIVTSRIAGQGFTATESDSNLTLVQTTADDDADPIGAGVLVVRDGTNNRQARVAATGALTAKSYDLTPVHIDDATYYVTVRVGDRGVTAVELADSTATVDEIVDGLVAQLNALLDAVFGAGLSVLAAADTATATKLILTADIAGLDFEVEAGSDAPTATWTVTETTSGKLTDLNKAALGVTLLDQGKEGSDDGSIQYAGGENMSVRRMGVIPVICQDGAPSWQDDVYGGVGSSHQGLFRKSASGANYIKLDPDRFAWLESGGTNDDGDVVALLMVNLV